MSSSSLAVRFSSPLGLIVLCLGASVSAHGVTSGSGPLPATPGSTESASAIQRGKMPDHLARYFHEPVGPTIADAVSTTYRFEKIALDSADGKRHYRVQVGIPRAAPPAAGYPVLYMLDGNAALATLTSADLDRLAARSAPVLVALGYDVATRYDVAARSYDYTPPVVGSKDKAVVLGRVGGGADIFLDLMASKIKPAVQALAPIDQARQTLWGHSHGGLLTLYTLLTRPELFQRYVAGDPSIWWGDGAVLDSARVLHPKIDASRTVVMYVGNQRRSDGVMPNLPYESAQSLCDRFAAAGATVRHQSFPDYSHLQMFDASLRPALDVASDS